MASKNRFNNPYANMHNAGGNHQAQTIPGIIKEGRTSYQHTIDKQLGTNKAPDGQAKKFAHIVPPPPAPKAVPTKTVAHRK